MINIIFLYLLISEEKHIPIFILYNVCKNILPINKNKTNILQQKKLLLLLIFCFYINIIKEIWGSNFKK